MTILLLIFWSVLIFSSIVWYAVLLLYVGIRGGRDIARMTRALQRPPSEVEPPTPA